MTTARSRMRVLLATTSVTALMAVGSTPLHAACVVVTGAGVGYTNPLATTIDCIDVNDATLTGNVVNNGTLSPGLPDGITVSNTSTILGAIINTGVISTLTGINVELTTNVAGGISNSGQITADTNGIVIGNIASFGGGIVNSGTIIADVGDPIRVNPVTFTGGILNSGTISGGGDAVNATDFSTFSGGVTNTGTITGATTAGILLGNGSNFSGGVVNGGLLSSSSDAIKVEAVSSFAGGITNSGQILSATGDGIAIDTISTFAGGIANGGTITSGEFAITAITVANFSGGVSNSGRLVADEKGINFNGVAAFSGGVSNSGTITVGATAIDITDVLVFSGGITNSGSVITTGSTAVKVSAGSLFSGGIVNSGTVVSGGYGYYVSGVSTFLGGIVNTGGILVGYTGIVANGVSTFSGGVTNSGTISGSQGIVVNNGNTFSGAIANSGTISGTSASINLFLAPNAMTINQTGGVINGRIRLSPFADVLTVSGGAINGNIVGQGLNIVNFALGGGSFTYAPAYAISAVDQLNVNSGFVTLNGANAATTVAVNGGTLEVGDATHSAATLNAANGLTVGSGGTLMGYGTVIGNVAIPSGATLSPGGSIGTMNVAGDLAIANGSYYNVEVNPAGASSKTIAVGAVTIAGGTVRVTEQPGTYLVPIKYTILTSEGSVGGNTGNGSVPVTPPNSTPPLHPITANNAVPVPVTGPVGAPPGVPSPSGVTGTFAGATSEMAFLTPELTYDAFNVFLTLSRNATYFASVARTPNQRSVGRALDASATGSELVQLLATQTVAGAQQAYDALSGEVHASVQGVLLDDSRYMRQAMLGRLRQSAYADGAEGGLAPLGFGGPVAYVPGGTTLSASAADFPVGAIPEDVPMFPSRLTFWSQAVGAWESIDGNGNAAEAQRNFGGLFTGIDAHFGEASRIGIVGGYTQSSVSVDERLSSADVDSGHVGIYAATSLDGFNLRGGAAYAFHDLETSRTIVFPGLFERAQADYDGDTGQVFGEIGYGIVLGHIAAEPFAGLAWAHTGTDDFAETGGIAALDGADSGSNATYSTLGIRVATVIMLDDGTALIPRASAAWQHVFGDLEGTAALGFQSTGADFSIAGVPIARNAALVEAGVDVLIGIDARLGIAYTGALADDVQDHAVKGNLTWKF